MAEAAFVVGRIDPRRAAAYRDLVCEPQRALLGRPADDPQVVGVGATRFGRPIGLALAEVSADSAVGTVRAIFVRPGYRGIGVGTALLTTLESWLAGRGCRRAQISYQDSSPATTVSIAALLRRCGWEASRLTMRCRAAGPAAWEASKPL